MAQYRVPIVESDLMRLWCERWPKGQEAPTERALLADADGSLSRVIIVTAGSAHEAAREAERRHVGCVAIASGIQRLD